MARYQPGLTQMPDGSLRSYFKNDSGEIVMVTFSPDGLTLSDPVVAFSGDNQPGNGMLPDLAAHDGELHAISTPELREVEQKPGGPTGPGSTRMYDVWHARTTGGGRTWEPARIIWHGYCGGLMDWKEMKDGRILVPLGSWVSGRERSFPTGAHVTTVVYSDDGGASWTQSESELVAPCYPGYNGNNYGACEPAVIQLEDGRIWMLMRTQTGVMYESYSHDNGTTWSDAQPSRFFSSTSPSDFDRLPDGRLVNVWNNYEMPPRVENQFEYGGRDALHVAISDDDGRTWRGFREIYRDALRNDTPPQRGDRGTAYPRAYHTETGTIVVVSGQGAERRNIIVVDPEWVTQTRAETHFENGLDDWIAFKPVGPPRGAGPQRDRILGPELLPHPDRPDRHVLHLRRPDENIGDGAAWNFPLGWAGSLTLRLMLNDGHGPFNIALGDRGFNLNDNAGERYAQFNLPIASDGQLADGPTLPAGKWHSLTFRWNLDQAACAVSVDGQTVVTLPLNHPANNGVSDVRLRSLAQEIDSAGMLVESASADIENPVAPPQSEWDNLVNFAEYRRKFTFDSHRDGLPFLEVDEM
jgi:hypothetical protein